MNLNLNWKKGFQHRLNQALRWNNQTQKQHVSSLAASPALSENPLKRRLAHAGFTLVEMMIVISIIALIAGFVTTNIMKRFDEAKVNATRIQINQMGLMLDDFRRVCGRYPTTDEGLDALVQAPASINCKNFDPDGFVKGGKVPQDSWNEPFEYTSDGHKYTIRSHSESGVHKDISSDDN